MAHAPEPDADDMLWTVAMARIVFGPAMNIQAPPNLSPGLIGNLIAAGVNDWGGVSPVTPDHVNPEAPWPAIERLRAETAAAGKCLTERLAIYPEYVREAPRWLDPASADGSAARRRHRRICARRGMGAGSSGIRRARPRTVASGFFQAGRRDAEARPDRATRQRREIGWTRATSSTCSRRAAVNSTPSASRPTLCARPSAATPSATSSTATSTTPTSATTAAGSARFPRAGSAIACAVRPTTSIAKKSRAACARPGTAAPPKSACRAASIRATPARPIFRSSTPPNAP